MLSFPRDKLSFQARPKTGSRGAAEPERLPDRDKLMVDCQSKQRSRSWAWQKREVDLAQEHFDLSYGSIKSDPGHWVTVARVGSPKKVYLVFSSRLTALTRITIE